MEEFKNHTFVICAYKESKYLEECIESLEKQIVKSNIIMCTSTPNDYIKNMAQKYNIPLYINEGESGIGQDWNFGVSKTTTDYVTVAHQDDIYNENYLKEIVKELNNGKDFVIAFGNYEEIKKKQRSYSGKTTFEKEDMLRVPFIKVNDEINYDELCGREIKNSKYYIKQALQTIDFELNNVGGSVKSEAVIDATTKALTENARKMIFDSDFILYLKEENKEQPYFALKVDNTDVLVSVNVDECKD